MKKLTEYASGNFLKAINVKDEKESFLIVAVEEPKRKDKTGKEYEALCFTVEKDGTEFDFDVNKTNAKFLVNKGYDDPLTLVGKKIYFKKALVRNPNTNMEVEGLRICDVQ